MGARHSRLAASMAAAWEAEVVSARRLAALAEQHPDAEARARLRVMAAFSRAHASRLLARLSVLGRGPLPVPPEDVELGAELWDELRRELAFARVCANRYATLADLARKSSDLSSAWVCELNRGEEEDCAAELQRLVALSTDAPAPGA